MKRSTAQLLLPIIKAYSEGAEIEWQRKDTGSPSEWYPCKENPQWIDFNNYRVQKDSDPWPSQIPHPRTVHPEMKGRWVYRGMGWMASIRATYAKWDGGFYKWNLYADSWSEGHDGVHYAEFIPD